MSMINRHRQMRGTCLRYEESESPNEGMFKIYDDPAGRYHGWRMDALREWIWSDLDIIMVGPWMVCVNGPGLIWTLSWLVLGTWKTTAGATFSAAKSTKHRKYRCGRRVRGARAQHAAA